MTEQDKTINQFFKFIWLTIETVFYVILILLGLLFIGKKK